ncbi:MAG: MFS transporter [Acetobacteraceae bacterium]|nr:MFS transporter [Acetobacteraceae bacterium]MSP30662.1 MFS transporter [Acetobacteraceae bacterium]
MIGASVMMSLALGMRQSLGLFLPSITVDLGLTALDYTFAIAVQNIAWGVSQAPLGAVADRFGLRPVLVSGAAIYVLATIIMSLAGGLPALTLANALIGVSIACTGSSLAMTATARAVSPERRSMLLGIVGAFSSVGTLVIAPVLQFMLVRWDWRIGVVLFILLAIAMLPAAFMAGAADKMPQSTQKRASFGEIFSLALRNRRFVVMSCAYFVCGLQLIFLNTHLPNYLALCGQDPMLGATALAIIGGVNIVGSWTAGWLGGIYPKHILLGITYLGRSAVLTLYFITPPTPTSTLIFAAAMGMLWLGVIPLVSGYVAELFGTRYMATILGLSFMVHQMGSVIGAWGGGMIIDAFGSYDLAWRIGVMVGVTAGLIQILLGGPTRNATQAVA